ncbi:MtrB/PioB family outer membrane beta-barrel protein [Marinobacterium aestuariivivens]|uniref:MtrB/PioB family outer membrane beta-barrel protein n=1 Tax=Marinobacterium aestuariivivens TaxID=1698799 RepID=A0ABW2A7Q8_9GAMM
MANENARINLPYGYEKHRFSVDAGYRIRPRTKLTLGYQYDQRQRDFQEVDKTREHTLRARVNATPLDTASGWVEVARGVRDGSGYIDNRPFLDSHTQALLDTLDEDERLENHPALRKFHLADRDRDAIRGRITLVPNDRLSFGLDGSYTRDDYEGTTLGLGENRIFSTTLDASYSTQQGVDAYVFLTHENLRYEQRGHSYNPLGLSSLTDPAQRWSAGTEDRVYTAGVGAKWSLLNDKLDLDVAYSFSTAETGIDVDAGSALEAEPLSDLNTRLHRVDIRLDYKLRDNLTTRLGYRYESLDTEDFARDGIDPDTIPSVLTLNGDSPDYRAHTVGVSLIYKF